MQLADLDERLAHVDVVIRVEFIAFHGFLGDGDDALVQVVVAEVPDDFGALFFQILVPILLTVMLLFLKQAVIRKRVMAILTSFDFGASFL